jgi:hypothetical protein
MMNRDSWSLASTWPVRSGSRTARLRRGASARALALCSLASVAFLACSGASTSVTGDDAGTSATEGGANGQDSGATGADGATGLDGGSSSDARSQQDAYNPPPPPPPDPSDGTPTRQQCTGNFGSSLTSNHGRLDGILVSVVNIGGSHSCNGDSTHVHLQVRMGGAVYDIAVNSDTLVAERDLALPDGAWSEGWHTSDSLDYATLGLHSSDFAMPSSPGALAMQIEKDLATANHISVFATGYGPTGAHLVHRQGGGRDGALVIHPLSSPAHLMMFTFTTSSPF